MVCCMTLETPELINYQLEHGLRCSYEAFLVRCTSEGQFRLDCGAVTSLEQLNLWSFMAKSILYRC